VEEQAQKLNIVYQNEVKWKNNTKFPDICIIARKTIQKAFKNNKIHQVMVANLMRPAMP
jgi:hypothetical protein